MRRLALVTLVLTLTACQINLIATPIASPITGNWEGTGDGLRVALSVSESPSGAATIYGGTLITGSGTITTVVTGESVPFRVTGVYNAAAVTLDLEVIDASSTQGTAGKKYYGHFQGALGSESLAGLIDGSQAGTVGPFSAPSRAHTAVTFVRR